MFRKSLLLLGGLGCLFAVSVWAQDPVATQLYGSGVHAYFSHQYRQAYEELSKAVGLGTADPRCFYFRGLCYLNLGREEEAEMDFQKAAELETQDVNRFYDVSRALERIQGSPRILIEQHRREARLQAAQRAEQLQRQRYGELRQAEQRVLEQQAAPATLPAAEPEAPAAIPLRIRPTETTDVGPGQASEEPAAEPLMVEQPAAVPAPATAPITEQPAEQPPTATNPFQEIPAPGGVQASPFAMPTEPAEAESPAAVPFGAPAPSEEAAGPLAPVTMPAAQEPAATEPGQAPSGAGVFGAIGQALGEAMGGQAPAPAGDQTDDPFGGAAPAPTAGQPVQTPPASPPAPTDAADPFGAIPAPQGAIAPATSADEQGAAAPAEQPQGQPPADMSSDPFGAQPAGQMPAQQDQAEEAPAPQPQEQQPPAPDNPFAEDPFRQ